MRPQPHRIHFLTTLVGDPRLDQVFAKYAALQQELVILLEVIERLIQTPRHGSNLGGFLGFEIVQIFLRRLARIDFVFDPVQAGHEHGGKGKVGVCSRIRETHFNPLRLRAG